MIQMSWPPDCVCIVFSRSIQLFLFCLQKFPAKESTIIMKEKGSCKLVLTLTGGWDSMYRPRVSGLHAGQSPWKLQAGPLGHSSTQVWQRCRTAGWATPEHHDSCLEGVDRPQWARGSHIWMLSGLWIQVAWVTVQGKEGVGPQGGPGQGRMAGRLGPGSV